MGIWLGYAKTGKEADVARAIRRMGLRAEVPRNVVVKRRGKRRYAEPVVSPVFPNVVMIDCSDAEWYNLAKVRFLARTLIPISQRAYDRDLRPCFAAIRHDALQRLHDIRTGNSRNHRLSEYRIGDELEIIGGVWAGHFAKFRRMVECADALFPMIEATMDIQLLGKDVTAVVDPIITRRRTG